MLIILHILRVTKEIYDNCSNAFRQSSLWWRGYTKRLVSTKELINLKITNRTSSCTKKTSPLTWNDMWLCAYFLAKVNELRLNVRLSRTRIWFCFVLLRTRIEFENFSAWDILLSLSHIRRKLPIWNALRINENVGKQSQNGKISV